MIETSCLHFSTYPLINKNKDSQINLHLCSPLLPKMSRMYPSKVRFEDAKLINEKIRSFKNDKSCVKKENTPENN